jgi:RNA methyltransferase, TrmH family
VLVEPAATAQFVRRVSRNPDTAALAERLLAGEAGPPQVVGSGWRRLQGVLILGAPAPGGERRGLVAAQSERALRDLLLRALPRGEVVHLDVGADWHLGAVAELVDGGPDDAGGFIGVKRGGQPAPPTADHALLERREPLVELLRELTTAAGRERHGRFVIEGPTLVGRAIADGLPVETVVYTAGLLRARDSELLEAAGAAGIACRRASDGLMGTLTATRPLPDVLAAAHLRLRDASELVSSSDAILLAAENVQNPDNLGMVLRTADAAGVEAVLVAGEATDPLHRNCVRAARGAVGRIPIFRCADLPAWAAVMRDRRLQVLGATAHGDVPLHAAELAPPVAVVVGNEETGITPETLAACSARVVVPMAPGQDSLNVGVAAGVLLFEIDRRLHTGG